jgi:hypothetical protein
VRLAVERAAEADGHDQRHQVAADLVHSLQGEAEETAADDLDADREAIEEQRPADGDAQPLRKAPHRYGTT